MRREENPAHIINELRNRTSDFIPLRAFWRMNINYADDYIGRPPEIRGFARSMRPAG